MTFSEDVLPGLYRSVLKITRQHGAFSLGRINHRMFPHGQHFRMASGNRFFVPGDPHFFGYLTGHEPYIASLIEDLVRPGDVCFDVGANIGYFTSQMAALSGKGGLVAAYEPDDKNFDWLVKNATLAASSLCKVEVVRAAVSERPGQRLVVRGAHSTLHQTEAVDNDGVTGGAVIASVSLDSEAMRLNIAGAIRLVKIDVEGHEPAVLRGMDRLVRGGKVQYAIIEINPGDHAVAVENIISNWGSRVTSTCCWIAGKWRDCKPSHLMGRSDALVKFR